jgi:hypothetical protein
MDDYTNYLTEVDLLIIELALSEFEDMVEDTSNFSNTITYIGKKVHQLRNEMLKKGNTNYDVP